MENQTVDSGVTPLQTTLTYITGIICAVAALLGLYWIVRIIPGILHTISESGFSFISNTILFHLIWLIFFLSLLVTGIKLFNSALKKRNKDLVSGITLYFLGASLVVIGLFYLVFQEYPYALMAIIAGILCIYVEGTTEIA